MVVAELLTKLGFQVDSRELHRGVSKAKSVMSEFKSFVGKLALGYSFVEIGRTVLNAARELETMQMQLRVTTGSADKMKTLFKDMRDYAVHSSYYMKDVAKSGQLLLNQGVQFSQVMPVLRQLGDIAGADHNKLNKLAYTYGHVANLGYLTARERNMFVLSGQFNPLREYAKIEAERAGLLKKGDEVVEGSSVDKFIQQKMTHYTEDLLRHRKFSKAMVDEAIAHATTAGGMFFRNQMLQMTSFTGKLSTMLDNLLLNAAEATQKLFPVFNRLFTAIGEIPFDWLGEAFEHISNGILYLWEVIKITGVADTFEELKLSVREFLIALNEAVGGSNGAGDAIVALGVVLGFLIRRLFVGLEVIIKVATWIARLVSWFKQHREVTILLGIALASVFGSMLLGKLFAATNALMMMGRAMAFVRAVALAISLSKWQLIPLLFESITEKIMLAGNAMKMFAMSTVGLAGLAIAAIASWAWAGYELYKVNKENAELEDRTQTAERGAEILERRKETLALAREYEKAGNAAAGAQLRKRAEGQLAAYHQLNADLRARQGGPGMERPEFGDYERSIKEEIEKTNKLLDEQNAQAKKDAAAAQKSLHNININLDHKGSHGRTGMTPQEVLNLSEKAVRAAFTVQLQRAMTEAE